MGMQPRNMLRAKLGSFVYAAIADRALAASDLAVGLGRARVAGGAQLAPARM
jgi:hypothetical protein